MRRFVIVGNGVAALAAAEAIRELEPSGEIWILGDDPHGYYSRPGLAYLISGEITEKSLFPFTPEEDRARGFQRRRVHVERVDTANHFLIESDGTIFAYDRLLLAPGAAASPLNLPGAGLKGVVKLDHLDDARHFIQLTRRAKSAVVIGGGITALELVEGFISHGITTHYLLRGERYWSNVLDETEAHIVERRLEELGVRLHYKTELIEILGKNDQVAGVRTTGGELIACDMLAAAIGIQPRLELAQNSGLLHDRGILVDEFLQTSAPDIFAAGDGAQVFDPPTGKYLLDSLWTTARDQGRVAGRSMVASGNMLPYQKKTPLNVTRLAGITTTIIGRVGGGQDADLKTISRGDSEIWRQNGGQAAVEPPRGKHDAAVNGTDRVRLMIAQNTLSGAVVMGRQDISVPIKELISLRADISPIREAMLQTGASLAALIGPFWSQWRQPHAAR